MTAYVTRYCENPEPFLSPSFNEEKRNLCSINWTRIYTRQFESIF